MSENGNTFLIEKGERGFSLEITNQQIRQLKSFLTGSMRGSDRDSLKDLYSRLSDRGYALIIRHGKFEDCSEEVRDRTLFSILWSSRDHYYNRLTNDQEGYNPWYGQDYNSCRFGISEIALKTEWEEEAAVWLEEGQTAFYAVNRDDVLFPWLRKNCPGLDSDFDNRKDGTDYETEDETFEELIKNSVMIDLFVYKLPQKENEMSNTTSVVAPSKIKAITARVQDKGLAALEYQAGKSLNAATMSLVRPRLPMMMRGYADHPVAPVVVALGLAALAEFLPEGEAKKKAIIGTDLMLGASMMDGADKLLNVEEIVNSIMSKLPTDVVKTIEDAVAAK